MKPRAFKNPVYIGDPINAIRIFNEKEVDELFILDIGKDKHTGNPDFTQVSELVSEAFMPVAYGGRIKNLNHADNIFFSGCEKVVINHGLHSSPSLLTEIANKYGEQSCVASIDYKKNIFGKPKVFDHISGKLLKINPVEFCLEQESKGAGEILLTCVDREGTYMGFDTSLLEELNGRIKIPVIIGGGAGSNSDFAQARCAGADGCAIGSMFVFRRPHNAVLISYSNEV